MMLARGISHAANQDPPDQLQVLAWVLCGGTWQGNVPSTDWCPQCRIQPYGRPGYRAKEERKQ